MYTYYQNGVFGIDDFTPNMIVSPSVPDPNTRCKGAGALVNLDTLANLDSTYVTKNVILDSGNDNSYFFGTVAGKNTLNYDIFVDGNFSITNTINNQAVEYPFKLPSYNSYSETYTDTVYIFIEYTAAIENVDQVIDLKYPCFWSDGTRTLSIANKDPVDIFKSYDGNLNKLTLNFNHSMFVDPYYYAYADIVDTPTQISQPVEIYVYECIGQCVTCTFDLSQYASVCNAAWCGDGILTTSNSEECDNDVSAAPNPPVGSDGCSSTCTKEPGFQCSSVEGQ